MRNGKPTFHFSLLISLFFEPLVGFEPTTLYRAATTKYPCYVPILGDSEGAGRTGLARFAGAKVTKIVHSS